MPRPGRDYQLQEVVGQGAFGVVRRATHKPTNAACDNVVAVCPRPGLKHLLAELAERSSSEITNVSSFGTIGLHLKRPFEMIPSNE